MITYRIDTMDYTSNEYTDLKEAERVFAVTKDSVMADGVDYDSYVELTMSEDDFETEITLIRAVVVEDEAKFNALGSPRDNDCDYDWWAKWEITTP